MANPKHVAMLRKGVAVWNDWRRTAPRARPDLSGEDLSDVAFVERLEVSDTARRDEAIYGKPSTELQELELSPHSVAEAANLARADLRNVTFPKDLVQVDFSRANLTGTTFPQAACLSTANFSGAVLRDATLIGADLSLAKVSGKADLSGALLAGAQFIRADLSTAIFDHTNLSSAKLWRAHGANAVLKRAILHWADLSEVDLPGADFSGADLGEANLAGARLRRARLRDASLRHANLVGADVTGADLSGCRVYGVAAWGIMLDDTTRQNDLVITPEGEPEVNADSIEVAQFIYLLLRNEKIRDVIDTIGKKGVLLLGRFTDGRMAVLDRLRVELRQRGFVPMVFNFEKPRARDLTETVRTLVGLSRFVIADITSPRSAPAELQATIPDYMVPFVPIIEANEQPFDLLRDLLTKHRDWVLPVISYASVEQLAQGLDKAIIEPALERFDVLLKRKAERMSVTPIADILAKPRKRTGRRRAADTP